MPWKEAHVIDERMKFIAYYLEEEHTLTDLCLHFGISRKTGYKYIKRYKECNLEGLRDYSRAPHRHPNETKTEIRDLIIWARKRHPTWGPKKLLAWLYSKREGITLPAPSTTGGILKRNGMVRGRRRRHKTPPYTKPFVGYNRPNDVWSADFKGWFLTGDGKRCNPLTISDGYSRYLLRCRRLARQNHAHVQPVFESAFREYGLPLAIRTDNGSPFVSVGVGGLTRLSAWWIKLGITPERIEAGHPEQNSRHERMHRTLKFEATRPPKKDGKSQQEEFDRFREEYNNERPHEALGQKTPTTFYRNSDRSYPNKLREIEYPSSYEVRWVRHNGEIKWGGEKIYLSEAIIKEPVGLEQLDDRYWQIYFGPLELALLDDFKGKLVHTNKEKHNKNNDRTLQ